MEQGTVPRALRYPLTASIRYRTAGTADWHAGVTLNISRSGVLFTCEKDISLGTGVEIWMTLPPLPRTSLGADLVSTGVIVRGNSTANAPQLAARFCNYCLGRSLEQMEVGQTLHPN